MADYNPEYPTPSELEKAGIAGRNQLKEHPHARDLLLPMEDESEYLLLRATYFDHYQPVGPTETFLTRELAQLEWRIRRCTRIETNIFNYRFENQLWFHRRHVHPGDQVILPRPPYDKLKDRDRYGEDSRCMAHIYNRDITGDKTTSNHLRRYELNLRKSYFDTLKTLDQQQAARLKREAANPELKTRTNKPTAQPAHLPEPAENNQEQTNPTRGPKLVKPARRSRKNEPKAS